MLLNRDSLSEDQKNVSRPRRDSRWRSPANRQFLPVYFQSRLAALVNRRFALPSYLAQAASKMRSENGYRIYSPARGA